MKKKVTEEQVKKNVDSTLRLMQEDIVRMYQKI